MKAGENPLVVEQSINVGVNNVWNALTEVEQMRKWYFENIPGFKAEPGFQTEFNVQSAERNFLHKWKVTEVEPIKMINYSWEFENYPGKSSSKFELFEKNSFTDLKLTVEVHEDFPGDVPEFTWESCKAGWEYFLGRLKDFCEKQDQN